MFVTFNALNIFLEVYNILSAKIFISYIKRFFLQIYKNETDKLSFEKVFLPQKISLKRFLMKYIGRDF